MKSETATIPLDTSVAEKVDRVEGDPDSDPNRDRGFALLAASGAGEAAVEPPSRLVGNSPNIRARQSRRPAIWLCAIGRQNLDRRFHFHHLPGSMSHHQHPHERIAEAARKDRRASRLVHGRSGERYAGGVARLRGKAARTAAALGFSHRPAGRHSFALARRLQARLVGWRRGRWRSGPHHPCSFWWIAAERSAATTTRWRRTPSRSCSPTRITSFASSRSDPNHAAGSGGYAVGPSAQTSRR